MNSQFRAKGLREERGRIRTELEKLGTAMTTEGRAMTSAEREKFNRLKDQLELNGSQLRDVENELRTGSADPGSRRGSRPGRDDISHEPREVEARQDGRRAFRAWALQQHNLPVSEELRAACSRVGFDPRTAEIEIPNAQKRAMTVTTTGGGYLIAQEFSDELDVVLVAASNIRAVAKIITTETGADMPFPTSDDTGNTGELLAINTAAAFADPTLASVTFSAYKYSSKAILVPNELMQDGAFDMEAYLAEAIGMRIGDIQGTHFTTGDGSSKPKGVVTCASAGITTAAAAAFTADELTRLALAVNPAYKLGPSVGYMMKEDVLGYAMMLKDASGRPLLRESYADNIYKPMLNGYPVFVNQKMTGLTSGVPVTATKHVLFGNFSKFVIRDAGGVRLRRLNERWADADQTGFIAFLRSDSNTTNSAAIKYLLQA